MKKIFVLLFVIFLTLPLTFFTVKEVVAIEKGDDPVVHFFYSPTCPHCQKEEEFLDRIEEKYPNLEVNRYRISDSKYHDLLFNLAEKHGAERFLGVVPLTFVGKDFFVGFDDEDGVGAKIESSIKSQLNILEDGSEAGDDEAEIVNLPIVGEINVSDYSLPVLAVMLGFLDGFNVCSLGALILILGLVISLRSRKKIAALGGTFVAITAIVYGFLIFLWYKIFSALSPYMGAMEIVIGFLGLIGGFVFFKDFLKYRKYGPSCQTSGRKIANKLSRKVEKTASGNSGIIALSGVILLFAATLAVVEFPCSAAIPVIFAGLLASSEISAVSYIFYISIFVLLYMLDELIVFGIAVWKMKVWVTSPRFVVWATLVEALLLLGLGVYYLVPYLL